MKVLKNLPTMKFRNVIVLWQNANRILSDPSKADQHAQAEMVIHAIDEEWERRRASPLPDDDYFDWPTTDAKPGRGDLNSDDWEREGLLKVIGYKVGIGGETQSFRKQILAAIFRGAVPPVFPSHYVAEWSSPGSPHRLRKMARTIAAFTRNAKRRRDTQMSEAIRDWERDLDFLHDEYYVGEFGFEWPPTVPV
jgi:hypothetical protein